MSDIIVIGGVKGMVTANTSEQLMAGQQNPGEISLSCSGTGRNIAENLARMGVSTALAAAAGSDIAGKSAKLQLEELGVDTRFFKLLEGQNTATNIAILNIIGDLVFALDSAGAYQCMSEGMLDGMKGSLDEAKIVCADGSLPEETLRHLTEITDTPLFFDPYTEKDAEKAKTFIGKFDAIKPNRAEASAICGMEIFSEEQLMAAGQWFADQGVRRTFITLSGGGVYYKEGFSEGILRPDQVLNFVNEEGAGDAFSAAVLDGILRDMDIEELAAYGMKAAAIALEGKTPVNPLMSRQRLEQERTLQGGKPQKERM